MNTSLQELPLKDIHLPPGISAWPPAPGWLVVSLIALSISVLGTFLFYRFRHKNAYRRHALTLAKAVFAQFEQHHNLPQLAADCSELLRRVAKTAYGASAACMTGENWIVFLDQKIAHKSKTPLFRQHSETLLLAPYNPKVQFTPDQLGDAMYFWIQHHKV